MAVQKTSLDAQGNQTDSASKDLAAQLEQLSSTLMALVSARDYTHPLIIERLTPDFQSILVNGYDSDAMAANTRSSHIENLRDRVAEDPEFTVQVISTCADVDEGYGIAHVWLTCRLQGYFTPQDLRREAACRMDWRRRRGGKWVCEKFIGMTGSGAMLEGT